MSQMRKEQILRNDSLSAVERRGAAHCGRGAGAPRVSTIPPCAIREAEKTTADATAG
jgi:hypothetical protein